MTVSANIFLCVIRILQGYMKIDIFSLCSKKQKQGKVKHFARDSLMPSELVRGDTKSDEFQWLEKSIMENVYIYNA